MPLGVPYGSQPQLTVSARALPWQTVLNELFGFAEFTLVKPSRMRHSEC
jgi:hypothetical protein